MKKTLNVVLAVILAVAMFASVAYVASPERTSEYQISLVSVKAVNVQDATQGVRSYAELVDTTRAYQVNDVIYLAITSEVKNLEKYPTLKSIAGKDVKVVVGSPSIDLSYAKLGTPTLLANIWSGYTAVDVATVGWYAPAQVMLDYDKNANEVSWKFRGYTQYGMGTSSAVGSADVAKLESSQIGNSYFAQNLVVFNPYFNTSTKKIEIPAIKLKKSTNKWVLGETTYTLDYEAPDAIAYTMVLTGVTKDNAGASKGTFYAKIEISGAEKFEDYDSYYVADDGTPFNTKADVQKYVGTNGLEWREYVKVDIKKLEIAGAYNVYRYWIPASALTVDIPAIYAGDKDNYADPVEDSIVGGKVLAYAAPDAYDNATSKSTKLPDTNTAGAIRTIKAYRNWTEAQSSTGKTYEFPATSVIFTNYKAVYAPGFYGGKYTAATGSTTTAGSTYNTETVAAKLDTNAAVGETATTVDYFSLTIPADSAAGFRYEFVEVYEADKLIALAGSGPNPAKELVYGTDYTVEFVPATCEIIVRPVTSGTNNVEPLSNGVGNQWVVIYRDESVATTKAVETTSIWNLNQVTLLNSLSLLTPNLNIAATPILSMNDAVTTIGGGWIDNPIYIYDTDPAATTATSKVIGYTPVFAEVSSEKNIAKTGLGLTFSNLVHTAGLTDITAGTPVDIQAIDNVTAYYLTARDGSGVAKPVTFANRLGKTYNDLQKETAPTVATIAFTTAVTGKDASGRQYITVSGLYYHAATAAGGVTNWKALDSATYYNTLGIVTIDGTFTFNTGTTTDATGGSWDTTAAAAHTYWDDQPNDIVVGHNGITLYTICSNSNDKPYVTLATETNYFVAADDGYGIAMYDNINYNRENSAWGFTSRIYRSNDTNLARSIGQGHVDDGATIISAMKYFGLDTSFGTTYKVVDETFESKGAAAVYSENVEGEFQYGTITIIPDNVEEGTEEEPVEDEEPEEEPEEEEEPIEEPIDEPVDDVTPPVVKTGDASANIAIALAAAAIVAAAGLAFVMKKVR